MEDDACQRPGEPVRLARCERVLEQARQRVALARALAPADEETRGRRNVPEEPRIRGRVLEATATPAPEIAGEEAILVEGHPIVAAVGQRECVPANRLGEDGRRRDLAQLVPTHPPLEQLEVGTQGRVIVDDIDLSAESGEFALVLRRDWSARKRSHIVRPRLAVQAGRVCRVQCPGTGEISERRPCKSRREAFLGSRGAGGSVVGLPEEPQPKPLAAAPDERHGGNEAWVR